MELTRREFFTSIGAALTTAAIVSIIPPQVLAQNNRATIWRLLEEAKVACLRASEAYQISPWTWHKNPEKGQEAINAMTQLMEFMKDNLHLECNEQIVGEVSDFFYEPETFDAEYCSDTAFGVLVIRKALKDYNMPLVRAAGWKELVCPDITRAVMDSDKAKSPKYLAKQKLDAV